MYERWLNFLDRHPAYKERIKRFFFRAVLMLSPSLKAKVRSVSYDHRFFLAAMLQNCNKNGRELHSLMHLRHVIRAMQAVHAEPSGEILEVGSGRAGLPILLLLIGFDKVHVNELTSVINQFDRHFVESIHTLASLMGCCRRALDEVVVPIDRNHVAIRPECIGVHAFTDAAQLDLGASRLAAVVSFTVLEHLRDPRRVLEHLHGLLAVDGWMCHVVDMRDHEDFRDPLHFLTVEPSNYLPCRGDWCNRLRHSDFVRLFDETGFSPVSMGITSFNKLDARNATDFWSMTAQGLDCVYGGALDDSEVWVTDEIRSSLHADNRQYDLADLSILQAEYVVRRAA